MREYPWVELKVRKGGVVLTHGKAYKIAGGPRVVALCIDCDTKYAEVFCTSSGSSGGPILSLIATKDSLHVDEKLRETLTEIEFPDYPGWTVFASGVGRYTVEVCLVKW